MPDNHPPTDSHSPTVVDKLRFTPTVDAVAKRIMENKNNEHGFTVGIFGDWGTGKSSFLLQLKKKLKKNEKLEENEKPENDRSKYIFVCFQAWRFRRADNPEVALVNAMFATTPDLLQSFLGNAGGTFLSLLYGIKMKIGVKDFAEVEVDAGKTLDAASKRDKQRYGPMTDERFFLHQAIHKTFSSDLKGKLCVVFIDDLDRCMNEDALYILEALKAIFDVPNCVFVIAADRRKIKEAITTRYSEAEADTYFRKFINLSVSIPRVRMDAPFLKSFLDKQLAHTWRRDNRNAPE